MLIKTFRKYSFNALPFFVLEENLSEVTTNKVVLSITAASCANHSQHF